MAGQFCLRFLLPLKPQGSFHAANLRQETDRQTDRQTDKRLYFPSEGRHAVDFFAQKIRLLRPGSKPRSWVPEASMLTTRRSLGKETGRFVAHKERCEYDFGENSYGNTLNCEHPKLCLWSQKNVKIYGEPQVRQKSNKRRFSHADVSGWAMLYWICCSMDWGKHSNTQQDKRRKHKPTATMQSMWLQYRVMIYIGI
jgi:hypothetical protein